MRTPPRCIDSGWEDARTDSELIDWVRSELALILEGQDGTQHYTARDIAAIKRWLDSSDQTQRKTIMEQRS